MGGHIERAQLATVFYITPPLRHLVELFHHTIPSNIYHSAVSSHYSLHPVNYSINYQSFQKQQSNPSKNHNQNPTMQFSILIASIFAISIMAAPTPAPSSCNVHCCQSLQLPDSAPMTRLLNSLSIPRSEITGLVGVLCTNTTRPHERSWSKS